MSYANWLAIASALVVVIGISVYIRDLLRGKSKPNLVSWFLWGVTPLIGFGAAIHAGADAWATSRIFFAGFLPFIVFFIAIFNKQSYWKLDKFDYACGALSIITICVWLLADSPRTAVLLAATADGLAAIPTFRKTWKHPESETGFTYTCTLLANLLIIPSITTWNIENAAFQIYLIISNLFLMYSIYRRPAWTKIKNILKI